MNVITYSLEEIHKWALKDLFSASLFISLLLSAFFTGNYGDVWWTLSSQHTPVYSVSQASWFLLYLVLCPPQLADPMVLNIHEFLRFSGCNGTHFVAGTLMEKPSWRTWLTLWRRPRRRSSSLTGGECHSVCSDQCKGQKCVFYLSVSPEKIGKKTNSWCNWRLERQKSWITFILTNFNWECLRDSG